ncbi:hypothetical protein KIH31_10365 [Paenarthrobacter sp. DKR-5]|uniref:hypothetical protein n=1 Tax=Paenarthrobacter sp. DKR-5 TaxID=2835535 RepID=UPI001BDD3B4C|nr:hypothetical protein [Paenarthrobacter sp. DKR-5]MBT1003011.1 hypothetical protein [Paenarthrobacter sp. DKR-5]
MSVPAGKAARLRKPSWKDPRLLVGILLVLASVAGVVALVGAADRTTEVYAARNGISVGERIDETALVRVRVRLGDLEGSYLTPAQGVPGGQVALRMVPKGELVARSGLGSAAALDRKPVAITVEDQLPKEAVAGSRVDVWVSPPDARNGFSEPKLLLSGAEISDLTPASTALGSSRSTVVQVLVPDAQLPGLLGAQANKARIAVVWNPAGGRR